MVSIDPHNIRFRAFKSFRHIMERSIKVAVIGPGTASLVTARELKRESHRVILFEKNNRIGGTWVYDPRVESDPLGMDPGREIVHSGMYLPFTQDQPSKAAHGLPRLPICEKRNWGPDGLSGS